MTVVDLGLEATVADLDRAATHGPAGFGPRPDLLRYGWASAVLERHPDLHLAWATTPDRAVRRAVMRSPDLPPIAAEALVAVRHSGMHTLGANPVAPPALLVHNPGARRRRQLVDRALGGDGLAAPVRRPNDPALLTAASATVDLMVTRASRLDLSTARRLAGRSDPRPDPWVLARLGSRFGAPVWDVVDDAVPAERRRAARALVDLVPAQPAGDGSTPVRRVGAEDQRP